MSKSRIPIILLALIAVGALAYGVTRLKGSSDVSGRAATEAKAEEAEQKECEANLALFYNAWKKYKADNKGATPPNVQALIPKYIPDTSKLICPTAARLDKEQIHLDRGSLKMDGKSIDSTYGFQWLTAGFPKQAQKQGDTIPLVVCKCHQQAIYTMGYNKKFKEGAFDDEERGKLVSEVANAPVLAVRMNGKVEALSAAERR